MTVAEHRGQDLPAEIPPEEQGRSARRVVNAVAIMAEAFAAWNALAWYLSRAAAAYTRPDLANIAASAQRRELFSLALVVVFTCAAVYSLSRSPRRVTLSGAQRYLRSALWALAGIAICFAVEVLVLALLLRGIHLQ